MSTFESAYKSLLQGVSQQLPQERLPGQLTAQVNMMSDPATNLRRRPGLVMRRALNGWVGDATKLISWFTDISGFRVHIILNTADGSMRILDEEYNILETPTLGAYGTGDVANFRATSVGNEFFICNIGVTPFITNSTPAFPNNTAGFFYVASGSFGRQYNVTVSWTGGSASATYTTPGGTGAGDAAVSTAEYIASVLAAQLLSVGPFVWHIDGPYIFFIATEPITVTSSVSTTYAIASGRGFVRSVGELPARLPGEANGYIMRVGSDSSAVYYRYEWTTKEWLETGSPGSPEAIWNAPRSVYWDGALWRINEIPYEGRTSGDDTSNPKHDFMEFGITGMSTYQGRLVLMSGPLVSLSASGKPRRFFRSTVTSVLPSDAIEIGSSTNTSAAYTWAIPFQKDLLLFSRAYQAVIPSGNQAITPSTATVVPTSGHEVDVTCGPVNIGRTVMYPSPRSESFFGIMEMLPSQYTDSQYLSNDSTPHLPKYLPGRCRFALSSSIAGMALFAPSGDLHTLVVHEYLWDNDTKVQQAWHQWTFPYPVASAHFFVDQIIVILANGPNFMMCSIDPRAGSISTAGARKSYHDMQSTQPTAYTDHTIPVHPDLVAFDAGIASRVVATVATGPTAGERIGTEVDGDNLITVLSYPAGSAYVGIPFRSTVIPTPPKVTDYKDDTIHSGRATILRFLIGTKDSAEFEVDVTDNYTNGDELGVPTLHWDSPELELGRGLYSNQSISIVPCRTDMRSTALALSTGGTGELNIVSLEYVARYQPKIKRR